MRTRLIGALVTALLFAGVAAAQEKPVAPPPSQTAQTLPAQSAQVPVLTEVQALKAKNFGLKRQLFTVQIAALQEQVRQQDAALTAEQQALEADLLKGTSGYEVDWTAGTLKKKAETPTPAPLKPPEKN